MKVSIVIPVCNEENTIKRVIDVVLTVRLGDGAEREIIVVDDGSSDATPQILKNIKNIKVFRLEKNQGKGAAITRGFREVLGDVVVIQDADLEYDPKDLERLLEPIVSGRADVVFGNRFLGERHTISYIRTYIGNRVLTLLSNIFSGLFVGDMEVGYKAFRKEVINAFAHRLVSKRFGIEPELVSRVAHSGPWRIAEVSINYFGRTYQEGKKIRAWDGIKAIFAIVYFNIFDR